MKKTIKIILAEDQQVVLEGLASLLKDVEGIEVVGMAQNGHQALQLLKEQKADVAVLDISMPVLDGLETTAKIKTQYPDMKVLILTMYNREEYIKSIIASGASGYILKNKSGNELFKAIRAVHEGEEYFTDSVRDVLIKSMRSQPTTSPDPKLTTREKEVLRLIGEGLTTRQMSKKLFIAPSTIETHRRNLITKLGVKGSSKGLMKYAIENGFLEGK